MTPAARVQAAIEIFDAILDGVPAEKALLGWSRRSRFAGSKDRAAVRDHVFDALRARRSFAALGGADTGRAILLGMVRAQGMDASEVFSGLGHAPAPLGAEEEAAGEAPQSDGARLDLPDWLVPLWTASLGAEAQATAEASRRRAPVFLRANLLKTTRAQAAQALAGEGIETAPHEISPTALLVTHGARRVAQSRAYNDGLVELQDGASQAVIDALEGGAALRILDYCAGGGGKSLALAAAFPKAQVFAHDIAPARMKDLPDRAERAGAKVTLLEPQDLAQAAPFDLVLCDAPCSGSGAWRRAPEGKWALSEERFADLLALQAEILDAAADLVAPQGLLAYATCSVLEPENGAQVDGFIARHPAWTAHLQRGWSLAQGGDGFFTAHLRRG